MAVFEILLCIIIIFYLKFVFTNWRKYVLSWRLPGPLALPLVGNGLEFFCRDDEIFNRAVKIVSDYPSPMRFWFGPKFVIVISDAERASKVMSSSNFIDKDDVYRFMRAYNGNGLIAGSGPKWKRDRKLMAPIFLKKTITEYLDAIQNHIDILIKILQKRVDGPKFNVEADLHRCATDFVSETILGTKYDAQSGELDNLMFHISRGYEIIHSRIIKFWLQVEWIYRLTQYYEDQVEGTHEIHTFLRQNLKEVENRRKCGIKQSQNFESFLDRILDIRDEYPAFANNDELIHHLSTLHSASEDTVTTVSAFLLLLFGKYPKIQEKVYREIVDILGERQDLTLNDLDKFEYLKMCLNDVLRLFPIAPFIMRKASQDFPLDDFTIPRDCSVVISIHNIHRDPKYWEKPDEFYPEHFLPEAVNQRHKFAFLPFSAGPRGCLGKPYALMALTVLIVKFVKNYEIFAEGDLSDIELVTDISVRAKDHNYLIKIKKR